LEAIWKTTGYLCSQRLKAALHLWLPWARQRLRIDGQVEKELLSISPRQIDNRLRDKKRSLKKKVYSTTRPGKFLKHMIPIRTICWDIHIPGFLEVDLMVHCGQSLQGLFGYTLNTTDISTAWSERRAVLGKGASGIVKAMSEIKHVLPFHLRGIDSDSGEEFINYSLREFCIKSDPRIEFTRSRPNKKYDNAHIEQLNNTQV